MTEALITFWQRVVCINCATVYLEHDVQVTDAGTREMVAFGTATLQGDEMTVIDGYCPTCEQSFKRARFNHLHPRTQRGRFRKRGHADG